MPPLLGAFGMLGMALLVLALRHVLTEEQWVTPRKVHQRFLFGA